jgi:hypothetical protein
MCRYRSIVVLMYNVQLYNECWGLQEETETY